MIRIIRNEDEPKPVLIARFKLTDVQAEAILNMRLAVLRKLEEIEIKTEHEQAVGGARSADRTAGLGRQAVGQDLGRNRGNQEAVRQGHANGKRKTEFADRCPQIDVSMEDALIEKEPVTIVLSEKGWIRALKGHEADLSKLSFKTDDTLK